MDKDMYLGWALNSENQPFYQKSKRLFEECVEEHRMSLHKVSNFSTTQEVAYFKYLDGGSDKCFMISGFPGTCSGLVLSQIEARYTIGKQAGNEFDVDKVVSFAEALCRTLFYSSLYVSTTKPRVRDWFIKLGFVLINTVVNPHSGSPNFFLVHNLSEREVSAAEKSNVDDDDSECQYDEDCDCGCQDENWD